MRHSAILRQARQFGLALAICAGLLHVLPKSYAEPPQADVAQAIEAAEQAYREVAAENYTAAIRDFRSALATDPSNTRWRKDLGFIYLAAGFTEEAAAEFQKVYAEHPEESEVALQLGYLYAAAGRTDDAKEMFTAMSKDADPRVMARAKAGLDEVRRDSKLWFVSVYAASFYQSRFSNEINSIATRIGLRPSRYFQPYVGLRLSRDVRSKSGALPQIFSDNSAVVSVGLQSSLANTGVTVYAEAGSAVNLIEVSPRSVPDYRAGVNWFRPWGSGLTQSGNGGFISHAGSLYADAAFYSRYDRNVIGSLQLREGIHLPTGRVLPMQMLAAINFVKDSNRIFYNNVVEVGPVVRITPLRPFPSSSIEAQYLRGFYTIHDSENPYGSRYKDVRVFLIWSKTF